MPDKNSPYRKLKGSTLFESSSLYAGQDHLLSIRNHFFIEEYLRFYYRDIQAILTRKTIAGKVINICLLIALTLFLLPAFLLSGGWVVFFLIMASIIFIFLITNLIKGPTVHCHVQTLVQTARLNAVNRMRGAEKIISQLKPLIEESQGAIPQGYIKNQTVDDYSYRVIKEKGIELKHEKGTFHLILFSFLLLSTGFIILGIFFPNLFLSLLSGAINLGIGVILIISLRKQHRSNIYISIKIMTWSITGYLAIRYIFSYLLLMFTTLINPNIATNQYEIFKKTASLAPLEHPWIMGGYFFFMFLTIGIGITGIILTLVFRKEKGKNPTSIDINGTVTPGLDHE
ncbi:MAG: hypothetical protein JW927_07460 [Deltaproteobacteria bacterium]|nr:hypothetical protein [Deltaproteobacteria bacterium]